MEGKHGCLLVLSGEAASEAERLQAEATVIEPIKMSAQLIGRISSIDGAVLIDQAGTCYGMGVILDGRATPKGRSARGARYNSAVRYVETRRSDAGTYACCAVVISEDGTVDLVPDLKPRIRRSGIENALEELQEVLDHTPVAVKRYNQIMTWLEDHSFYLSKQQCSAVNAAQQRFLDMPAEETTELKISFQQLKPDEEMDDSYFFDA